MKQQEHYETFTGERKEPNPREEGHYHPCPSCGDAIECWCPFPEMEFEDELALCFDCRNKSLAPNEREE